MISVAQRDVLDVSARRSSRLLGAWRWEPLVAVVAVAAAAVAFWVTLRADFLAHPAWAAVQRADVILGPVAVGLYWHHRRPGNRLGLLLIALGLVTIPYVLEGSTVPALFGIGVLWEVPISVMTLTAMLAFPNGRLEGLAERLILAAWVVGVSIPSVVFALTVSRWAPGGSIVGCRTVCPANGLAALPPPSWLSDLSTFSGYAIVVVDVAAAALLGWRFVRGTPPRRRAMAIGASLVMLFFLVQAAYHAMYLVAPGGLSPSAQPVSDALQWVLAGARSLIWYGFLFALVAAELFAGRALRGLIRDSMGRPSLGDLERMLRGPLGDPGLRLGFWRSRTRDFAGAGGEILAPRSGQALTEVKRDGRPAVALAHDRQLAEDPELLQAAGAVALLAQENAELEGAWKGSLRELADSRTRLVTTADRERRKLERDLHDGAQQQLMAVQYNVRLAQDQLGEDGALAGQLETIGAAADQALDELRTLAHGIYPHVLRDLGLVDGLRWFARTVPKPVEIIDRGVGRCGRGVEAAIYFCSTEAIQNAVKYAGDDAHVAVTLGRDREGVQFAIADDGVGMDPPASGEGDGLIGMRDRIGAVGGALEIVSAPGSGTTVRGTVPLDDR